MKFSKSGHHPDFFLLALAFLLLVFGLVILASASSDLGQIDRGDAYYYLKHQLIFGVSAGLLGFFAGAKVHYQFWKKLAWAFLLINLGLLAMVFTPLGHSAGGASRWLNLGPVTFQPSELLKLTFVIYLAAWFANPKMNRSQHFWEGMVPFFTICGIIGGLLILQPATSTVIILLASGLTMYFLGGAPWRHILLGGAVGAAVFAGIIWSTPYRMERILSYLDPERDTQGSSYQISQALTAIGSGGLTGMGYGQSTSKVNALPTPMDDSIFAVAAQELGFLGASALVLLFGMFVFRLIWIARGLRDRFGQLILAGFAIIIALQSLVNMGAISGLFPLTGVPLPFVSFGGTALAVFMTMSGISVNISKYS